MVCRNPQLAAERARKREDLLAATERELAKVRQMVDGPRGTLRGADAGKIGERAGRVSNKYKVAKHFELQIADGSFSYQRKTEQIQAEAALDGLYVLRTTCPTDQLTTQAVVRVYKQLKLAERAYRTIKDALDVRPIRHHLQDRVEAHFFLFLLAYYLLFELQARLAPMLFTDDTPLTPADPVAPARRSPAANSQSLQRPHPRRPARLQPHRPDRRTRNHLPQPAAHRRQPTHLPPPHQPQHRPGQGARTPRRQAHHVAKARPAPNTRIPRQHAGFTDPAPKKFRLKDRGLARALPVVEWLPRYERRWLRGDLAAGIAVTALVVPKNLGYADIAGVPLQNGLYAAAAGGIVYALFCTSRRIFDGA